MIARCLRLATRLVLLVLLAGCTFPPLVTPTPRATPAATPSASPTPTPMPPTRTPTPAATPDFATVPAFEGGELIETAIDGLRVRQRPGTSAVVVAGLLPLGADLEVRLGPIPVDGFGWYLVGDASGDAPEFEEGWIAAGFEPEPFLRSTGESLRRTDVVATFALSGDAEYGPVEIDDRNHRIRWIATDPEEAGCRFGVLLAPANGEPVQAIRATVGDGVVPGTLQPSFFASQDEVRGQIFITVESDCAWALTIERVRPDPTPSPTGGG